jgi:hypothetical protein
MKVVLRSLLLLALLFGQALAQDHFLLSWAEGDLDGDGVPERAVLVSPDSSDPGSTSSRKYLVVLRHRDGRYEKALTWPMESVSFYTRLRERHLGPQADFWGLSFHPPIEGRDASFKLTFTPGSGEFVQVVSREGDFLVTGSGD